MGAAAKGARPVSFELGGKNAAIVFADATSTRRSPASRAPFANCGQVCLGTERVYVQRPIFEKFVAALKKGRGPEDRPVAKAPASAWAR